MKRHSGSNPTDTQAGDVTEVQEASEEAQEVLHLHQGTPAEAIPDISEEKEYDVSTDIRINITNMTVINQIKVTILQAWLKTRRTKKRTVRLKSLRVTNQMR